MIHIFYMRFDTSLSEQEKDLYMQFLSEERRQRVSRKRSFVASLKCMQTGLFLRYGLEQLGYGEDYHHIVRRKEEKPYISGNPVYFNLSHSGEYVVLAFADAQCGVDMQEEIADNEKLARRILHEEEYAFYKACPDMQARARLLTQFWCMKEAYLKYTGEGLTLAMANYNLVDAFCRRPADLCQMQEGEKVTPAKLRMTPEEAYMTNFAFGEYMVSLCAKMPEKPDKITAIHAKDVFSYFIAK